MRWKRVGLAILFVSCFAVFAHAQESTTAERLIVDAPSASTWSSANDNIIQLQGPVSIDLDGTHLTADQAVIWLAPVSSELPGQERADIVLLGNASLTTHDNHITRTGPQILVNAVVNGQIQLTAARSPLDMSDSRVFQRATAIRANGGIAGGVTPAGPSGATGSEILSVPRTPAGTALAAQPRTKITKSGQVEFQAAEVHQFSLADDTVAFELSGAVTVTHTAVNGDYLELTAAKVILFTKIKTEEMKNLGTGGSDLGQKITAAYLEGDVRMDFTPALANRPEQRLIADAVYYDFPTDRAILTGLVLHSIEPKYQIPVIIRAVKAHQLAQGEFTAEGVQLSTSSFAVPTYSVGAAYAYVHQENEANDLVNFDFIAKSTTFQAWGTPIFYWPYLSGAVNNGPEPLREFSVGSSSQLGTQVLTQWGLFEALGQTPPKDLDISFRVDERSYRGTGGGFDGSYGGSHVTDTGDPWSFSGDFTSYIMGDKGIDVLGGDRADVKSPTELRGRFLWEHQHFFPDDWQVQVRVGFVSDPNFVEYYYRNDFDNNLPYDASFYVKRQKDTEAITFLAESDTTTFTTNADRQQEQFDVQRLPELGYYRVGDSLADDNLTFFSQNTVGRYAFEDSHTSLAEQGFDNGLSPGLPSDGFTGTNGGQPIYRGDSRQELDWPVALGEFKIVPYVMERVTAYSTSPEASTQTRLFSGAGVRASTSFWHVDNSVESDLFDLHRLRHVIQPEVNLFTSTSTVDRSQIYNLDPDVDTINDITGGQIALHQEWETMRGGPGRLRSVDVFELNIEGNFFSNQPSPAVLAPTQFRGLYFPSSPETSIPRDGVNMDATWRLGDATAIFSDAQWNSDKGELAIADVGIAVARGDRLTYVLQDSYVQVLNSEVISAGVEYQLTAKYLLQFSQSFNFSDTSDSSTIIGVVRKFDSFAISLNIFHDSITHDNGFSVNLIPTAFASLAHLGSITGPSGLTGQMNQ